ARRLANRSLQLHARCQSHAIGDRARGKQLPTLMYDVQLNRQLDEIGRVNLGVQPGVEALAVLRSVEPLPLQPRVVTQPRSLERPFESGVERALKRERLPLQCRKEAVGAHAIRTNGRPRTARR